MGPKPSFVRTLAPRHFAALLKALQITAISRTKNSEKPRFSLFGDAPFCARSAHQCGKPHDPHISEREPARDG
jgi:hypothetical protein